MDQSTVDAITQAANEDGIDPTFALSVADRESGGNASAVPYQGSSIFGLFQMSGALRSQYGVGDSTDPYAQAKAWDASINDYKAQLTQSLGRAPTNDELYYAHYFGPGRASSVIQGNPDTNVGDVFTPFEMQKNPNFAKAGTTGALMSSISDDLAQRQAKFGGSDSTTNWAAFGTGEDGSPPVGTPTLTYKSTQVAANAPNFSSFGGVGYPPPSPQPVVSGNDTNGMSQELTQLPEQIAEAEKPQENPASENPQGQESANAEPFYGMSAGETQGLAMNPAYRNQAMIQARGGRPGQEVDTSAFKQPGQNLQNPALQRDLSSNPALGAMTGQGGQGQPQPGQLTPQPLGQA